jgi:hypothetical protein
MTVNDDLARWGEPPADRDELALADLLGSVASELLHVPYRPAGVEGLLEVSGWVEGVVASVVEHADLGPALAPAPQGAPPAEAAAIPPVELRLRLWREAGTVLEPVAATDRTGTVLRDLRRVPAGADRLQVRTGDRVRLEAEASHDGFVSVFNIGPAGGFNLLYPDDLARAGFVRARCPVPIMDVQLTPPAGRERLYAVWSRVPLSLAHLLGVARRLPGPGELGRVQEELLRHSAEDWHAVVLEVEHRG